MKSKVLIIEDQERDYNPLFELLNEEGYEILNERGFSIENEDVIRNILSYILKSGDLRNVHKDFINEWLDKKFQKIDKDSDLAITLDLCLDGTRFSDVYGINFCLDFLIPKIKQYDFINKTIVVIISIYPEDEIELLQSLYGALASLGIKMEFIPKMKEKGNYTIKFRQFLKEAIE